MTNLNMHFLLGSDVDDPYSEEALLKKYKELCAIRDERNATNAPLQKELDDLNETIEALNARTRQLAKDIEANWGNESWFELKRRIAVLAKLLSRADGPLATK